MSELLETELTRDLSPAEVANRTGLSRTLVYREIARGHLRAYKVGGRLRIAAEALEGWKQAHVVLPRRQPAAHQPRQTTCAGDGTGSFSAELRAIRDKQAA